MLNLLWHLMLHIQAIQFLPMVPLLLLLHQWAILLGHIHLLIIRHNQGPLTVIQGLDKLHQTLA